jgi:hypothetical protein
LDLAFTAAIVSGERALGPQQADLVKDGAAAGGDRCSDDVSSGNHG